MEIETEQTAKWSVNILPSKWTEQGKNPHLLPTGTIVFLIYILANWQEDKLNQILLKQSHVHINNWQPTSQIIDSRLNSTEDSDPV